MATKKRSMGREASDKELGIIISQFRKYLFTSFVRSQSLCLLNRLEFLVRRKQQEGDTWPAGGGEKKGEAGTLPGPHPWTGSLIGHIFVNYVVGLESL